MCRCVCRGSYFLDIGDRLLVASAMRMWFCVIGFLRLLLRVALVGSTKFYHGYKCSSEARWILKFLAV